MTKLNIFVLSIFSLQIMVINPLPFPKSLDRNQAECCSSVCNLLVQYKKQKKETREQANRMNFGVAAKSLKPGLQGAESGVQKEPEPCRSLFEEPRKKYYELLKGKPWGMVAEKYIKQLENEERELMREFFGLFKKGSLDVNLYSKVQGCCISYQEYLKSKLEKKIEVLPELKEKIEDILNRLSLNLPKIYITRIDDKTLYPMAADTSILSVNQAMVLDKNIYDKDEKIEITVLHELQHMLHDDGLIKMCMQHFINSNSDIVDWEKYKECNKRWNYFFERRADILAVLLGPKYADAAAEGFKGALKGYGSEMDNIFHATHPSMTSRIAYIEKIKKEMVEAKN